MRLTVPVNPMKNTAFPHSPCLVLLMTLLLVANGEKRVHKWCQNRATILHFTYITQLYFSLTFQLLSQHLWKEGNVWMICGGTECALNRYVGFQWLGAAITGSCAGQSGLSITTGVGVRSALYTARAPWALIFEKAMAGIYGLFRLEQCGTIG